MRRHSTSDSRPEGAQRQVQKPDVLPKVNKADMAGTMECIKEYLRSHYSVIRAPFVYVIRKTTSVQFCGNLSKYSTPDNEMITRILHPPTDKNRLHNEQRAQSVKEHTSKYEIDNRSVYDILDQINKDTDLYQYIKQHKSKSDGRGSFYAIHSRFLGLNHDSATASEAKFVLQMSMYDGEKKTWN